MVVLDPQVVIRDDALRDDEIVRLVAVRVLRRHGPGAKAERDGGKCSREERLGRGIDLSPDLVTPRTPTVFCRQRRGNSDPHPVNDGARPDNDRER